MRVEVVEAGADEASIVANLVELYLYDFSELGGPPIGEDGRYGFPFLDDYWREDDLYPFLIRVDRALAGFALVAERRIFEPGEEGHEMMEFFVLRGYRRRGVGREAARQLFLRFSGRWWVGELASNQPAIAFWRRVIGELTGGNYAEEESNRGWGPHVMQRFAVVTPMDAPSP